MENTLNVFHIESMGTLDGPGIRTVIFLKGCPLRCHYCHNPESWQDKTEHWISHDALFEMILKMKPYFKNGGGVTFSGGEPLLQAKSLLTLCKRLKAEQIHMAIDTSGCILNQEVKSLLEVNDLVILDIKHTEAELYESLTGGNLEHTLTFLDYIKQNKKPYWVRQVIVSDINDTKSQVLKLDEISSSPYRNDIELLAFQSSGMGKWHQESPFKNMESFPKHKLVILQEILKKTV